MVGLLPGKKHGRSCFRAFRYAAFLSLVIGALVFELIVKISNLINFRFGKVKLSDVILFSQYWLKTAAVIIIMIIFHKKGDYIQATFKQLSRGSNTKRQSRKRSWANMMPLFIILSSVTYFIVTSGTRFYNLASVCTDINDKKQDRPLFFTIITTLQAEYL